MVVVSGPSVVVSGVADWLHSAVTFRKSDTARLSREAQVSAGAAEEPDVEDGSVWICSSLFVCSTRKLTNQGECSFNLPSVCADVLLPSSLTFSSGQEQFQGFPCRFSPWFEGHTLQSCWISFFSVFTKNMLFFHFQVYLNLTELSEEPRVDACQQVV